MEIYCSPLPTDRNHGRPVSVRVGQVGLSDYQVTTMERL